MAKHIQFEVEGDKKALAFIGNIDNNANDAVIDLLDSLRKRGEYYVRLYAPAYGGELLRRIASTRPTPSVGSEGVEMEAVVGVREGSKYPLYVHGGTGMYKSGQLGSSRGLRTPSGFPIRSNTPGKPLTFQKRGEPRRWRMFVTGQKPKPFMYLAYQQLVPYARGKVARMFINRAR